MSQALLAIFFGYDFMVFCLGLALDHGQVFTTTASLSFSFPIFPFFSLQNLNFLSVFVMHAAGFLIKILVLLPYFIYLFV
jgi:hypothetical protein